MRSRRALPVAAALAVLLVLGFSAWRLAVARGPEKVSEAYLRALASGDAEAAKSLSAGSAARAAARLEGRGLQAGVRAVGCRAAALGSGWARVEASVELALSDGSADVGWYALDAVKTADGWRVVSFKETGPYTRGVTLPAGSSALKAAEGTFRGYLEALAAGDWAGAARFLAGPARADHEASAPVLGKGALFSSAGGLTSRAVYRRDRLLVAEHSYTVDGRNAAAVVCYWKTSQGWKITRVDAASTKQGGAGEK